MSDREIEDALLHVRSVAPVPSHVRDAAHARMVEAFETASLGPRAAATELAIDDAPVQQGSDRAPSFFRVVVAAAAALILGFTIMVAQRTDREAGQVDPVDRPAQVLEPVSPGDSPVMLDAGSYTSQSLGTTLTFDLETPLWVVLQEPGRIEFVVDPLDRGSGRLSLSRPAVDLPSLYRTLDDPDRLTSRPLVDSIGRQPTNSWVYRVNPTHSSQQECEPGETCVTLVEGYPSTGLAAGPGGFVHLVSQEDHDPLALITWAPADVGNPESDGSNPFESMLDSIELGPAQPTP